MICSTSWHLASLLQLSDGNASTALHLVIGNAMRCWARGRYKFSPCFKPTSYNNKQPRFFMRCSFGHIYGAVTTRVVNLGGSPIIENGPIVDLNCDLGRFKL